MVTVLKCPPMTPNAAARSQRVSVNHARAILFIIATRSTNIPPQMPFVIASLNIKPNHVTWTNFFRLFLRVFLPFRCESFIIKHRSHPSVVDKISTKISTLIFIYSFPNYHLRKKLQRMYLYTQQRRKNHDISAKTEA